jgi:acetyltransferase-like isoleucine patch superfamily enzyme
MSFMISNLTKSDKIKKIILNNAHLKKCAAVLYSVFGMNRIKGSAGNTIIRNFAFLHNTKIRITGKGNTVKIAPDARLRNCYIYISGNNNSILLGSGTILFDAELHVEDDNNKITIGDNTTIYGKTHLACTEGCTVSIGTDCMFSTDVVLRTGDSHSIIDDSGNRINPAKDITIGNHVWFGNKTTILKGVVIGDNCIVATGAIVTAPVFKSNIIIAGNPARVVKENINWLRERI